MHDHGTGHAPVREIARFMLGRVPTVIVVVMAVLVLWTAIVWYSTWLVCRAVPAFRRAHPS